MQLTRERKKNFSDLDIIINTLVINDDVNKLNFYSKFDVYMDLWKQCYWDEIFFHLILNPAILCTKIKQLRKEENLVRENRGKSLHILENDVQSILWEIFYSAIETLPFKGVISSSIVSSMDLVEMIFQTYFETVVQDEKDITSALIQFVQGLQQDSKQKSQETELKKTWIEIEMVEDYGFIHFDFTNEFVPKMERIPHTSTQTQRGKKGRKGTNRTG